MKQKIKNLSVILVVLVCLVCGLFFTSCDLTVKSIVGVAKTSTVGLVDTYTITYSDGSTSTFTVTNGKNGKDGEDGEDGEDGTNGTDGQDGKSLTILEVYNEYKKQKNDETITYEEFLDEFLTITSDNSSVINSCLQSSLKIYTEFCESSTYYMSRGWDIIPQYEKSIAMYCGSGVVYEIIEDDYTYVLTNYHVVYDASVNEDNGSYIARKIVGYLYGSEDEPVKTSSEDENGYEIYNYGDYGIEFEFVGGSIDYDIAVLRTRTEDIKAINENVKEVTLASNYYVGETAIAIGNPENEGISATQGIVSVDNEYITLAIDSTSRSYRSIRIDTSIYGGSSGGGLFNVNGELIGLTNAGDSEDQNINYAIPVEVVRYVTENILANYDGKNATTVKKATLGVSVTSENSKYVYDSNLGYGEIIEDVIIYSVVENSIASILELQANDQILSIYINGVENKINRYFEIGDLLLQVRSGNIIKVKYNRNNETLISSEYTISQSDLK